ncbi:MAG: pilus (MSHA type) biogenesis protein MshL [Sulfurospirillaceae bacterium]|nr:pilus (MSHA type) biogenesis protein MshL [Sulfurospirillaceae bacterium]MDD2825828.1 pilus (MSHA type) biogenesis protein MshL [Sulfurospirillaceae bacterium]
MRIIFVIVSLICMVSFAQANCETKFFTFSVKQEQGDSVSILDVLENVAQECKMTLIFEDSNVKGAVEKQLNYINVHDFSLTELLDLLLGDNNIFYDLSDNKKVLKLSYFKTKSYFIDYVSFSERKNTTSRVIKTGSSSSSTGSSGSSSSRGSDSTTMDFTSEFKFWDKIGAEITSMIFRDEDTQQINSKVLINQDAGMVTITGTKKQLERAEEYLKTVMKRLHKEILVEAKIFEVTYSYDKTDGVDWSKFELGISGTSDATRSRTAGVLDNTTFRKPNYLVGYNFSMEGLVSFLKTQGDLKVVSNPKVMTLNNQSAVINVGTEINYRYDTGSTTTATTTTPITTYNYQVGSTFVGITLDITPQVTDDNYIMLKINPIVSELDPDGKHIDTTTGIPYLAPDIKIKQLSSVVKVKDGNKVLVGGLIGKKETNNDTSVPGLSSIPLLGEAFKSNSKIISNSELIIVIIPHIVNGTNTPDLNRFDDDALFKEKL